MIIRIFVAAFLAIFINTAAAQNTVFEGPRGVWHLVAKDPEGGQWSFIPAGAGTPIRLDFVYTVEAENRMAYYMVRTVCSHNKNIEMYAAKPEAELGLGNDCSGEVAYSRLVKWTVMKAPPLPPEAQRLLKQ